MIEITIFGRGGQGAVTASQVLALAFEEQGIRAQAFPQFGAERTGQPVRSFVRASRKEIKIKAPITTADYSVVLDSALLKSVNVIEETKSRGTIIVNSRNDQSNASRFHRIVSVDVNEVARTIFPKGINMGMLGALVGCTRVLQIKSLTNAIDKRFPEYVKENQKVAEKVYELVRKNLV